MSSPAKRKNTKELKAKNVTERDREIQEVFHQIDLAQARMNKEQEEIESLAEETDRLLERLEYQAS
ncbi:MAG: hypothetical protein WBM44_12120 [Waterburya sp.]